MTKKEIELVLDSFKWFCREQAKIDEKHAATLLGLFLHHHTKVLSLSDVVQQRELLLAFSEYVNKQYDYFMNINEIEVDDFIKSQQ